MELALFDTEPETEPETEPDPDPDWDRWEAVWSELVAAQNPTLTVWTPPRNLSWAPTATDFYFTRTPGTVWVLDGAPGRLARNKTGGIRGFWDFRCFLVDFETMTREQYQAQDLWTHASDGSILWLAGPKCIDFSGLQQ
jgi:hypothetical protein